MTCYFINLLIYNQIYKIFTTKSIEMSGKVWCKIVNQLQLNPTRIFECNKFIFNKLCAL